MTGALRVVTLAQPALWVCTCSPGGTHETLPITAQPATARALTLRSRPRPAGSSTPGNTCNTGRNCEVFSTKPPSKAACSATRAGAFFVEASRCRRESGGLAENETPKAALRVCV